MIFSVLPLAVAADASWVERPPPSLPDRMHVTLTRYENFIKCVAGAEWKTAAPLFDVPFGSLEEQRILKRITGGSDGSACSDALLMRMTAPMMRGGIAEARYRLVYGKTPVPPPVLEVAPVAEGASFQWVGFNKESPWRLVEAFSRCLAERETGAVHAVLVTRIGSQAERKSMQVLSRRFGSCLQPGQRLKANSLTLRPWLGEAQYQLFRSRTPDQRAHRGLREQFIMAKWGEIGLRQQAFLNTSRSTAVPWPSATHGKGTRSRATGAWNEDGIAARRTCSLGACQRDA